MIGVPVPSIRICACGADGDDTGDNWANSSGAEVDTISAAALAVRVRRSGERANDERLMLISRVGWRQTYRDLDSTASEAGL